MGQAFLCLYFLSFLSNLGLRRPLVIFYSEHGAQILSLSPFFATGQEVGPWAREWGGGGGGEREGEGKDRRGELKMINSGASRDEKERRRK